MIEQLQEVAEIVGWYAAEFYRHGDVESARIYAAKADQIWRQWIEAKESEQQCQF